MNISLPFMHQSAESAYCKAFDSFLLSTSIEETQKAMSEMRSAFAVLTTRKVPWPLIEAVKREDAA